MICHLLHYSISSILKYFKTNSLFINLNLSNFVICSLPLIFPPLPSSTTTHIRRLLQCPTLLAIVVDTLNDILVDINPIDMFVGQIQCDAARMINVRLDERSTIAAIEQGT